MASFLVGPNTGPDQAAYLANLEWLYSQPGGIENGGSLHPGWGYNQFTGMIERTGGSYGTMGGGGGGGSLPQSYLDAYNSAKAANEQRYKDILTGYQTRYNQFNQGAAGLRDDVLNGYEARYQRGLSNLEGLGTQEKNDILRQYGELGAANQQDMTTRGLTGTTIMPTMRQGIMREQQAALSRVNERLQNQRLAVDSGLSGDALSAQERLGLGILNGSAGLAGDTLQFAERRTDSYPDYNQLAALAQGYGAAGGMNAFGGGASTAPQFINFFGANGLGYQAPQGMPNFVQPYWYQPTGYAIDRANGVQAPRQQPQNFGQQVGQGIGNLGGFFGGGAYNDFNPQFDLLQTQQQYNSDMPPVSSGDPQTDSVYQQVVSLLGRPPQSQDEVMWALDQLDKYRNYDNSTPYYNGYVPSHMTGSGEMVMQ